MSELTIEINGKPKTFYLDQPNPPSEAQVLEIKRVFLSQNPGWGAVAAPGKRPPAMQGNIGYGQQNEGSFAPVNPFANSIEQGGQKVDPKQVQAAQQQALKMIGNPMLAGVQGKPTAKKVQGYAPPEINKILNPPKIGRPLDPNNPKDRAIIDKAGRDEYKQKHKMDLKGGTLALRDVIGSQTGLVTVKWQGKGPAYEAEVEGQTVMAPSLPALEAKIRQVYQDIEGRRLSPRNDPGLPDGKPKKEPPTPRRRLTDKEQYEAFQKQVEDIGKTIAPIIGTVGRVLNPARALVGNQLEEAEGQFAANILATPAQVMAWSNVVGSKDNSFTEFEKQGALLNILGTIATTAVTPGGPSLIDDAIRAFRGGNPSKLMSALDKIDLPPAQKATVKQYVKENPAMFKGFKENVSPPKAAPKAVPKEPPPVATPKTPEASVKPGDSSFKDHSKAHFNFQNTNIEPIPKKVQNREYGMALEHTGDIFRELTEKRMPDVAYIKEKIRRTKAILTNHEADFTRLVTLSRRSGEDDALINELSGLFEGMRDLGPRAAIARDLNVALAKGDVGQALKLLDEIDPPKPPQKTVQAPEVKEAPKVEGKMVGNDPDAGATGLANQVNKREREAGKLGPEVDVKGMSKAQLQAEGKRRYEAGEINIERTMRRLSDEKRPATGIEYGAALEHKRRLLSKINDAKKAIDDAITSKRKVGNLQYDLDKLEQEVTDWQNLVDETKTAWSDSGRGLQIGSTINEGNLAEVLLERRRVLGRDLSVREKASLEKQVNQLKKILQDENVKWSDDADELAENLAKASTSKIEEAKAAAVIRTATRRPRTAQSVEQARKMRKEAAARILSRVAKSGGQLGADPGQAFTNLREAIPEIIDDIKIIVRSIAEEYQIRTLDKRLFDEVRKELPGLKITDDEIVRTLAGEWDNRVSREQSLYAELTRNARKRNAEPIKAAKAKLAEEIRAGKEAVAKAEREVAERARLAKLSADEARKQADAIEQESKRALKKVSREEQAARISRDKARIEAAEKAMRSWERKAELGPLKEAKEKLKKAEERMRVAENMRQTQLDEEARLLKEIEDDVIRSLREESDLQSQMVADANRKRLAEAKKTAEALENRLETLDDLEEQVNTGGFWESVQNIKKVTKEQQQLDLKIKGRRRQIRGMIRERDMGRFERFAKGTFDTLRSLRLGSDAGMLLRQGLYTMGRGKANLQGLKNFIKALGDEDAWTAINESYYYKEAKDGRLLEPIRSKAGLATSDVFLDPEEITVIRILKSVPGLNKVVGSLERGQSAFINTVRREIFDDFVNKFPDAADAELAARARFINAATGRSNWKDVPKMAQYLMTSPRYTASRWELFGELLRNPVEALKSQAARENLKDVGLMAGSVLGVLKIMEAVGFDVTWDPMSSDFLKVRRGNTVYDPTAGLGKVARAVFRSIAIANKYRNGEKVDFGMNVKDTIGDILSDTVNPAITGPFTATTGKTLGGFDAKPTEKGFWLVTPLLVSGFAESLSEDGLGEAALNAVPEFFGVGVNRYASRDLDELGRPKSEIRSADEAKVISELKRLGLKVEPNDRRKTDTDRTWQARTKAQGDAILSAIKEMVKHPSYLKLTPTQKKKELMDEVGRIKKDFNREFNESERARKDEENTQRIEREMAMGAR